jgi:tRNA(Ile)-lysidine synthase
VSSESKSVCAADDAPVAAAEARSLFADLAELPALILAVSGGPDSTALLVLVARWRDALAQGPKLTAVTIDHGLRPGARREAQAAKRLARSLGVAHRTMCWIGGKPAAGLQQAARRARYGLLAAAAQSAGARHVLTGHTLDDQAETVLLRLSCGSGIGGLAAMAGSSPLPGDGDITLVRPLLDLPKSRLIATLRQAGIPYADDPSNCDPRFTRARLRELMPLLSQEGLAPRRLALLARRARRSEAVVEAAVEHAAAELAPQPWPARGPVVFPAARFGGLPGEVALRLLGRAIACTGDEGPVELGKLEALAASLAQARGDVRFRRTLAGALVTLKGERLSVERAPPRRRIAAKRP